MHGDDRAALFGGGCARRPPAEGGARHGKVEFRAIGFHYGRRRKTGDEGVIERLSLNIPPGQKVGLIGRSGAGKSTFVSLLLRFYDLESGANSHRRPGHCAVTQQSLRRHIAVVTQDNTLLHRTIAENIRYGRPEASDAEMIDAAGAPTPMNSSWTCATRTAAPATGRRSAKGASSFRAASASASPSPG